ncbi:single-stranded DNA-binding protein [Virgibacillus dokdonensis]|uniref:Single-stranded DNA-binding protein n=1 Tax=Virgibacillus dokdonensis TaxID=302167 RepID=A0A3E0WI68_9BACI|nr:single-stranded DNA-binding protein [Virgibacillus dokdonensis]RFA31913.1 single-stranded DNA-binding protein [Virgibacillus dokdonensis]
MTINRVVLVGRLTKDPDLRYTPNGVAVANFTLAVNRPFSNQQGNREADFINCVVWRRAAENLANYMHKGSMIGVDGRIQTRRYEDKDKKTVFVTEVLAGSVQFIESKNSNSDSFKNRSHTNTPNYHEKASRGQENNFNSSFGSSGEAIDVTDDDLPF